MWARILNTAIGIWMMAAPTILKAEAAAATNDLISGPVVASMSIIACWEVTRPLRRVNTLIGIWLVIAPWFLSYGQTIMIINDSLCGVGILVLSLIKGKVSDSLGGGWSELWRKEPAHRP